MIDGDAFELELSPDTDPQAVMNQALATLPLRSVQQRRLSLNEVFIRLVGDASGEEEAAKVREDLNLGNALSGSPISVPSRSTSSKPSSEGNFSLNRLRILEMDLKTIHYAV